MRPVIGRANLAQLGYLLQQRRNVHRRYSAVFHDDLPLYDDAVNSASALAVDDLAQRIVERQIRRVGKIEQSQIGLFADVYGADLLPEAQHLGAGTSCHPKAVL